MKLRGRAYAAERVVCGWVLGCHFDSFTDGDAKRAGVLSMLLVSNRRVVHARSLVFGTRIAVLFKCFKRTGDLDHPRLNIPLIHWKKAERVFHTSWFSATMMSILSVMFQSTFHNFCPMSTTVVMIGFKINTTIFIDIGSSKMV